MCFGGSPKLPPPPPPPPKAPETISVDSRSTRDAQRRKKAAASGLAGTNLTRGADLGQAALGKTKLGG